MNFMHFSLSFVHVGHGILSYYIFHFLDGEEEPFFFLKKNRFNLRDNFDRMIRPVKSGLGLITALFFALAFEIRYLPWLLKLDICRPPMLRAWCTVVEPGA